MARKPKASKEPKPFWQGPTKDGITQSLFGRWLCCRERFRLQVVEGLKEDQGFRRGLEYGNMWHEAEEKFCGGKPWKPIVKSYCEKLRREFRAEEAEVLKWYKICLVQFPIYINHWKKHPETRRRKYLLEEVSFRVPYKLPSGRSVTLRGKWDAVYKQGTGIWLQENKTKGSIDEVGITQTLEQNLQVMWYLIALKRFAQRDKNSGMQPAKIKGVLYNVIRRPLAERSKHNIRQRMKETESQFYKRLGETIQDNSDYFFMRWKTLISKADLDRFKKEVFHPLMESFLDWWESINPGNPYGATPYNPWPSPHHYRFPFGVWNSLWDGWRGDYFEYLTTGRKDKLIKAKTLYPELAEV